MTKSTIQACPDKIKAVHGYGVVDSSEAANLVGRKFHFIGAGGIGMSGLAKLLLKNKAIVTGSDQIHGTIVDDLCRAGAHIKIGHDTQNLNPDVDAVVISTQHSPDVSQEQIKTDLIKDVIKEVIPADMLDDDTKYYINPTGRFVYGGPHADTGLTGRKIIVDTYGGMGHHGGGDYNLMASFVAAVANNDPTLILSGPEESLETHQMVFAAEDARRNNCVVNMEAREYGKSDD